MERYSNIGTCVEICIIKVRLFKHCLIFLSNGNTHTWKVGLHIEAKPLSYQKKIILSQWEDWSTNNNKANLRDLIAATGLVISNWIKIVNFSARVTVKFDGWPCKTIGHLFYATSSFVHLFVPIGEFKLKLQSGNAQSGSNWMIFRAVRPWNLTDDLAKQ